MVNNISQQRTRAFTLVELLIVVVILAVMAAILYPVFIRMKKPADYHRCLSNEKQLGLAFLQYIEDYDEKCPCGVHPKPVQSVPAGWAGQIYPYIKSTAVYKCPGDPTVPDSSKPYQLPISYAYNCNVGYSPLPKGRAGKPVPLLNPTPLSAMTAPASTVLLCEVQGVTCDMANLHGPEASSPAVLGGKAVALSNVDGNESGMRYATGILRNDPASTAIVGTAAGNAISGTGVHADGSNFLLVDGHAKWLRPTAVSAGLSNNIGSSDCTAGQRLSPAGKAGPGYAAGTGCPDTSIVATFSTK